MGQWIQKASMPTPRHDLQASLLAIGFTQFRGAEILLQMWLKFTMWRQIHGTKVPQFLQKEGGWRCPAEPENLYDWRQNYPFRREKARTGDPANYDIRDSVEVLDLTSQTWASSSANRRAARRASCDAL